MPKFFKKNFIEETLKTIEELRAEIDGYIHWIKSPHEEMEPLNGVEIPRYIELSTIRVFNIFMHLYDPPFFLGFPKKTLEVGIEMLEIFQEKLNITKEVLIKFSKLTVLDPETEKLAQHIPKLKNNLLEKPVEQSTSAPAIQNSKLSPLRRSSAYKDLGQFTRKSSTVEDATTTKVEDPKNIPPQNLPFFDHPKDAKLSSLNCATRKSSESLGSLGEPPVKKDDEHSQDNSASVSDSDIMIDSPTSFTSVFNNTKCG